MTSIRQQIVNKIETQLKESGGPASLTVEQGRLRNFESAKYPHTNILWTTDDPPDRPPNSPPALLRSFDVTLEHRIKAASGSFTALVDPLFVWGAKKVLQDESFGGLAVRAGELPSDCEGSEGDAVYGLAKQRFKIWYTTKYGDLESQS